MPELPEVETVRKGLSQLVIGKTISKVEVFWPKIIEQLSPSDFNHRVSNQTIHEIKRRGKFLIFCLDQDVIISHLRMEGKYHYFPEATKPNKHVHVQMVVNYTIKMCVNLVECVRIIKITWKNILELPNWVQNHLTKLLT